MENEEKNENADSLNGENENDNSSNEGEENAQEENQEEKKEEKKELTPFEKQVLGRIKKLEERKSSSPVKEAGETNKEFEARIKALELDAVGEVSENVMKEMETVKKYHPEKTYKQIHKMPFIQSIISEETKQKEIDDASISPDDKNTGEIRKNFKGMSIEDFNKKYDLNTKQGVEAYEKYKEDNAD